MKSPLQFDKSMWKDLGIDESVEAEPQVKLGFARAQCDELKKALWRVRTDLMIAQYQVDNADNEDIRTQHQTKVNEHKMVIKQFVRSVKVFNDLIPELEAEAKASLNGTK